MSGHRYISDSSNLFSDDIDDEQFLRNSRQPPKNEVNNFNDPIRRLEEQKQSFIERKKEIEERTVQSTQRSLGLLRDSEKVGIATAEELHRQREQLERTDKRLDEINSTLRFSQKHLNGIKSVFGSLKNYLSGKNDPLPNAPKSVSSMRDVSDNNSSNFSTDLASRDTYTDHPLTRMRNEDDAKFTGHYKQSTSNDAQSVIDSNLGEMLTSVVRLKGLAVDLSTEIDSQNSLIEDITDKTETADFTVRKQNKEMNKLLGKK